MQQSSSPEHQILQKTLTAQNLAMARSRASIGNTTPKKATDTDFKTPRTTHNALRRQQYKRAKRTQQAHAVKAHIQAADAGADPAAAKKQAVARKRELYRTWKPRGEKRVAELERLVQAQQAEIEELRRRAAHGGVLPTSEEPAATTPRRVARHGGDDHVEEEETPTITTTSAEMGVGYPTLPSVEAEEANETVADGSAPVVEEASNVPAADANNAGTPPEMAGKGVLRESSADTNAGTPRNIRRSPRKRAVKRESIRGR